MITIIFIVVTVEAKVVKELMRNKLCQRNVIDTAQSL